MTENQSQQIPNYASQFYNVLPETQKNIFMKANIESEIRTLKENLESKKTELYRLNEICKQDEIKSLLKPKLAMIGARRDTQLSRYALKLKLNEARVVENTCHFVHKVSKIRCLKAISAHSYEYCIDHLDCSNINGVRRAYKKKKNNYYEDEDEDEDEPQVVEIHPEDEGDEEFISSNSRNRPQRPPMPTRSSSVDNNNSEGDNIVVDN